MWKLKDEETARLFTHEMAARNDEVTKADDIQKKWLLMKETWLKASKQGVWNDERSTLDTRRLGGGIEMWKKRIPNESMLHSLAEIKIGLKINIL